MRPHGAPEHLRPPRGGVSLQTTASPACTSLLTLTSHPIAPSRTRRRKRRKRRRRRRRRRRKEIFISFYLLVYLKETGEHIVVNVLELSKKATFSSALAGIEGGVRWSGLFKEWSKMELFIWSERDGREME